jgi:hypothetical protein
MRPSVIHTRRVACTLVACVDGVTRREEGGSHGSERLAAGGTTRVRRRNQEEDGTNDKR